MRAGEENARRIRPHHGRRASAKPRRATSESTNARWRYLFDVIYYTGPILVVAGTLAMLFIVFVGYPGYL